MRINLDDNESIEPNMSPLLDCIFLLLIFFLVATSFEKQKNDEKQKITELIIQLPESATALSNAPQQQLSQQPLVITINHRGKILFNHSSISTNELHQLLKEQAVKDPNRRIRIDGDRNTPLQHIVHLLDLCEFEGLNNIGIRAASSVEY
ncbi:MAG: biopolymer transporter ExbD [Colwellia sp.]